MRKFRLFLGAIAFFFAFATAFAFRTAPAAINPAYVHPTLGCTTVSVTCTGNDIPCEKDLGTPGPGIQKIYDKQTSACPELKMAN